jgi:hypothetical protein
VTDDDSSRAESSGGDPIGPCPKCTIQVRRSELDIHLAHAHNFDRTAKKPARRKGRDRDRDAS